MKLFEYEAKAILQKYGIATPREKWPKHRMRPPQLPVK